MKSKRPLTNKEGEVRELTAEDFTPFRPAAEVLSPDLQAKLAIREWGPQKAPTKQRITIRLSQEVVEQFRATGEGWQVRVDTALRDWLKDHSPV